MLGATGKACLRSTRCTQEHHQLKIVLLTTCAACARLTGSIPLAGVDPAQYPYLGLGGDLL